MKTQRQPPVGELEPLPILEHWWDTISMEFIVELPEAYGHDVVLNVVDLVSKRAHFITTHMTIMAFGTAQLYLAQIWKLHRLLKQVLLD